MIVNVLLVAVALIVFAAADRHDRHSDRSGRRSDDEHSGHHGADDSSTSAFSILSSSLSDRDHDLERFNRHHETLISESASFEARVAAALRGTPFSDQSLQTVSSSFNARKELRDQRHLEEVASRIRHAQATKVAKPLTVSYQAVFSRNTSQVCIAASGTIVFTGNATTPAPPSVPFDQSNLTFCHPRTGGPVIFVAKDTAATIQSDSFDGNHDGQDDVNEAVNTFRLSQGLTTPTNGGTTGGKGKKKKKNHAVSEASLISTFLLAVRQRATVNGGSIDLKSLIVTGRQTSTGAPFAVFGGLTNRILISPCFPVQVQNPSYNFQLFGVISGWDGTFDTAPATTQATFVDGLGNPLQQTATLNLVASAFPNPNKAVGGTVQAGVLFGSVFYQRCTQFSYFADEFQATTVATTIKPTEAPFVNHDPDGGVEDLDLEAQDDEGAAELAGLNPLAF